MTEPADSYQQARTTLLRCWSAVLELPDSEISDSSNFFSDGGDSLLAVHLTSAASSELGVEVPLDPLFLDGSFRALVDAAADAVHAGRGDA